MSSPLPSRLGTWLCAVALFAAAAPVLCRRTAADPDAQRPAPHDSTVRHGDTLMCNDTPTFSLLVVESSANLAAGRVFMPVTHFDCPVTFLLPAGWVKLNTEWTPQRVINTFTLAAVFLNGVAAFGFLRAVGAAGPVAAAGALAYMAPNFVLYAQHMGHMNYVQIQWVAFAFWGLAATVRPGAGWLPAVGLGLAMGLQIWSSPSFTLYLAYVGLPVFAAAHWLATPAADRTPVLRLALRAVVAVAVAVAVAYPYLVRRLGAMPEPLNVPPGRGFTWNSFGELLDPAHPALFLGPGLAVLGVLAVRRWWHGRTPYETAMVATLAACAACMLPAITGTPFWVLHEYAPMFDRLRVPMRFFPFVLLMTLGLAATYLTACGEPKGRVGRWACAGVLLLAVAANWWLSPWLYGAKIEQPMTE